MLWYFVNITFLVGYEITQIRLRGKFSQPTSEFSNSERLSRSLTLGTRSGKALPVRLFSVSNLAYNLVISENYSIYGLEILLTRSLSPFFPSGMFVIMSWVSLTRGMLMKLDLSVVVFHKFNLTRNNSFVLFNKFIKLKFIKSRVTLHYHRVFTGFLLYSPWHCTSQDCTSCHSLFSSHQYVQLHNVSIHHQMLCQTQPLVNSGPESLSLTQWLP